MGDERDIETFVLVSSLTIKYIYVFNFYQSFGLFYTSVRVSWELD